MVNIIININNELYRVSIDTLQQITCIHPVFHVTLSSGGICIDYNPVAIESTYVEATRHMCGVCVCST